MDLKSGYPFWAIKNGLMCAFPQLQADISCDVVVVGGGKGSGVYITKVYVDFSCVC